MTMQNEIELFAATAQQLAARSSLIGGRPWGAAQGKPRIYMPSRRDCQVYFAFPDYPTGDEKDLLGGSCLKVFVDECGQHPNWYAAERKKLICSHYREGLALSALEQGDEDLARAIMDRDEDFDAAEVDAASGHMVNGRLAEARAALSL